MKSETDRGGSIIATVIAAALLLLAIAGGIKLLPKDKMASARAACVASNPCSGDPSTAEPN